jgi:hypothetical protein
VTLAKKRKTRSGAQQKHTAQKGAKLQLRELRLFNCACRLGKIVAPVPIKQSVTVKINPKGDEPGTVFALVELTAVGENADGVEALRVSATFVGIYVGELIVSSSPEKLAQFLPNIAVNDAWLDWREFVQNITVRMGLPPLRLPSWPHQEPGKSMVEITRLHHVADKPGNGKRD